ncbi:MAG: ATP-dependent DNA helicase RecG [Balneolaceae bacterium]
MKLIDLPNLSNKRLQALQKSGLHSPADLVMHFPRRYIDRSAVTRIGAITETDTPLTVVGRVISKNPIGKGPKSRLEVQVEDPTGMLKAVWFRGWRYVIGKLNVGDTVSLFGKVKRYGSTYSMAHPELDLLESPDDVQTFDTLVPVYPSGQHFAKAYITNTIFTGWIRTLLDEAEFSEFLPADLLQDESFPERHQALQQIHFPANRKEAARALERFKFEELLLFELGMATIKHRNRARRAGKPLSPGPLTRAFFQEQLPFELTEGQTTALRDIRSDLQSGIQMNRLIQGDVGSGKTVVAIGALLMAVDSGHQTAFMAPTEILAEQHYFTLKEYLEPLGVHFRLLQGGQKKALRDDVLSDIQSGRCQIVVGTHAIIQDQVHFHRLGLAVIDEQHRFGVRQRSAILQKGDHPHLLVMSATPIPRSLAMTYYSDLDVSILAGLPAGRKPIKTAVRTDRERGAVYDFVEQSIRDGEQVYVVFPLIEESEALDLKDATMGYEKLKQRLPDASVALLHGRMKPEEKEQIMHSFVRGEIDLLVSTTVIEVGVDVPNATIMIIEHAERFGLSQLHQLRGRIGRGSRQSYCILMPDTKLSKSGRFRLQKMVETSDGFEIAEADLKLRGPGDFLGTKQSGLPEFRYADIVEDRMLLEKAKNRAWEIISSDPDLEQPGHRELKRVFEPYAKERTELFGVG